MTNFKLNVASGANPAAILPVLLIATSVNEARPSPVIDVHYEDAATISGTTDGIVQFIGANGTATGTEDAIEELRSTFPFLRGVHEEKERVWLSKLKEFIPLDAKALEPHLEHLDTYLLMRSFLVGYSLSAPDIAIWGAIRGNKIAVSAIKRATFINLTRWFRFLEELCPWTSAAIENLNATVKAKKAAASKAGASYDIGLQDVEGGVVTRFPPEPSGYLHIGHAKAALLNDYFAHEKYKGTLLLRFDDTNPSKEKMEFQDAIIKDLELMGIKPDRVSFTSDYFQELHDYCVQMIKDGNAYADDTDKETMAAQRMDGLPSKHRDDSIEENLAHFEEMKKGTEEGARWCIRAKISVDNPNKALRDPVIYRVNNQNAHHRTGTTWKIYPTYDFCCPIVDSMEGVTHALRTNEYRDRNPQYAWMNKALKLRPVEIWDFSRMNFIRTVLSKRKLTKLVESGVVWGWDDPRFPTIRGIRRRGMTVPALREFIIKQGPSKNTINFDWTTIWATNKKYIDPVAPRHTAVLKKDIVKVAIRGGPAEPYVQEKPKHNKNPDVGVKRVAYSSSIVLDQEDAKSFKQDEEITLMNWGNAFVRKIATSGDIVTELELELHVEGDFKKTEKKVTWLSTEGQQLVPVELVDFDHLLTKDSLGEDDKLEDFLNPKTEFRDEAVADGNVAALKKGDIIQFERKGYYRLDSPYVDGKPAVFFCIPTGKTGGK